MPWDSLRRIMFVCVLTGIAALFFHVGDLSLEACDQIQDRLADLVRVAWPH